MNWILKQLYGGGEQTPNHRTSRSKGRNVTTGARIPPRPRHRPGYKTESRSTTPRGPAYVPQPSGTTRAFKTELRQERDALAQIYKDVEDDHRKEPWLRDWATRHEAYAHFDVGQRELEIDAVQAKYEQSLLKDRDEEYRCAAHRQSKSYRALSDLQALQDTRRSELKRHYKQTNREANRR